MNSAFLIPCLYGGCRNNPPIEDRFSATNSYAAILFSEHYDEKRYNQLIFCIIYDMCPIKEKN
jgi:hypothetical protein